MSQDSSPTSAGGPPETDRREVGAFPRSYSVERFTSILSLRQKDATVVLHVARGPKWFPDDNTHLWLGCRAISRWSAAIWPEDKQWRMLHSLLARHPAPIGEYELASLIWEDCEDGGPTDVPKALYAMRRSVNKNFARMGIIVVTHARKSWIILSRANVRQSPSMATSSDPQATSQEDPASQP